MQIEVLGPTVSPGSSTPSITVTVQWPPAWDPEAMRTAHKIPGGGRWSSYCQFRSRSDRCTRATFCSPASCRPPGNVLLREMRLEQWPDIQSFVVSQISLEFPVEILPF